MERTSYNVSGCSRPSRSHAAHWLVVVLLLLTACSSDAIPAAAGITVQWTTASEVNTAGFNLYRGERKEGPFTKINPQLIPASNDSLVGGKYRFQDANVTPGQTYYYQLEDVETGGATTRHGPIVITAPAASSGVEPGLVIALGLGVLAALSVGAFLVRKPIRGLKKPPAQ